MFIASWERNDGGGCSGCLWRAVVCQARADVVILSWSEGRGVSDAEFSRASLEPGECHGPGVAQATVAPAGRRRAPPGGPATAGRGPSEERPAVQLVRDGSGQRGRGQARSQGARGWVRGLRALLSGRGRPGGSSCTRGLRQPVEAVRRRHKVLGLGGSST